MRLYPLLTDEERKARKRATQARYIAKHPDYHAAWQKAHAAELLASHKVWRDANRAHVNEQARKYYQRLADRPEYLRKQAERSRVYRKVNPEKVRQQQSNYYAKHADKCLTASRLRHIRRKIECFNPGCSRGTKPESFLCKSCCDLVKWLFSTKAYPLMSEIKTALTNLTLEELQQWEQIKHTRKAQRLAKKNLQTLKSQISGKPATHLKSSPKALRPAKT